MLALDAKTGKYIWHFQMVHHDMWDRDLPAPPNLITLKKDGVEVDAVAQITKSGHVFIFDRVTSEPFFPIEEVPYPPSDLPGEEAWPTQPLPSKPPPFARQRLTEDLITNISEASRTFALERLRASRSEGQFIPPSREGTIIFPGFDGGGEWGGAAVDPHTGIMYVNSSEMAWILTMVESGPQRTTALPFKSTGYKRFLDPDGYPAVKPPWGTLNAIDLNKGEILWQVPLGEYPELTARGISITGTELYGGPAVTAGGLVFIAASKDERFRAFDSETGKMLWETQLPAGGYATPSVYAVNGTQYVVIAAGGGKMGTKSGDAYVAFRLRQVSKNAAGKL
jgi:quinoprotein glucose dehydrogenase